MPPPKYPTPPPLLSVRLWTVVACWKMAEAAVTKLAVAVAPKVNRLIWAPPVVAALRVTVFPETELITEFAATPVPLTAMPAKRPEASASVIVVALLMLAGSTTPVPAEEASRPRYSEAVSRRKPLASWVTKPPTVLLLSMPMMSGRTPLVTEPATATPVPVRFGVAAMMLTRLAPAAPPPSVPVAPALSVSAPCSVVLWALNVAMLMRV